MLSQGGEGQENRHIEKKMNGKQIEKAKIEEKNHYEEGADEQKSFQYPTSFINSSRL